MRRPPLVSYTVYALEATEYAKEQGQFFPFHDALYKAYWADGRDLGDLAVIEDVADRCDLNTSDLRQRLASRHYQETVMRDFQEATNMGVRGIPAFLIGKYLFTGARPYQDFQAVVERVLAENGA